MTGSSTTKRSPAVPAAGPQFDGCDPVQTHMTNSRLTDPEILEAKFPVLLREFPYAADRAAPAATTAVTVSLRRLEFRAPLSGALLANHLVSQPFGLEGGQPATTGAAHLRRVSGAVEQIAATASFAVTGVTS